MKKLLYVLCVLAISSPCFAKQNYSYSSYSNSKSQTPIINSSNGYSSSTTNYSNSNANYSIKSVPNTSQPTRVSQKNTDTQGEKISQVGSILYYDSGEKNSWKSVSRITGAAAAIGTIAALDPYIVTINGNDYIMVRGLNKTFVKQNILGLNDDYKNIFNSLKDLDVDKNGDITGWELKSANIRLARLQNNIVYYNDSKKDYNILYIKSIPITTMQSNIPAFVKIENSNSQVKVNRPGTYGTFDVRLANNLVCKGRVEFISKLAINNMVKGNK